MPQGVTNAPSIFQRLMEKCMGDFHLKEVLVFLYDLIIFSNSLEEHERRLRRVLNRLREYGLKLSTEKYKFFQSSVRYLGHGSGKDCLNQILANSQKLEAIAIFFLGFVGYYRCLIKDYAVIAKPLNNLTRG